MARLSCSTHMALYRNNQGKWSANNIKGFLKEVNLISQMERCQFFWSILSASGGKLPYGYFWNQDTFFFDSSRICFRSWWNTSSLMPIQREFNSIPTHSLGLLEILWNLGSLESTESSNMTILQTNRKKGGKGRWSDDPLLLWGKRSFPWWSDVFFGGVKVRKYLFPVYPSRVAFHGQHGDPLSQSALIRVVFIITCIEIPTSQTLHAWDFSTAGSTKSIEIAPTKLQNEDLQLLGPRDHQSKTIEAQY